MIAATDVTALPLTAGERRLLDQLLEANGGVVAQQALQACPGTTTRAATSNSQQVLIGRLRKKLADAGVQLRICTVRKHGYRLERHGGAA